jgi:hypothetical protein
MLTNDWKFDRRFVAARHPLDEIEPTETEKKIHSVQKRRYSPLILQPFTKIAAARVVVRWSRS